MIQTLLVNSLSQSSILLQHRYVKATAAQSKCEWFGIKMLSHKEALNLNFSYLQGKCTAVGFSGEEVLDLIPQKKMLFFSV